MQTHRLWFFFRLLVTAGVLSISPCLAEAHCDSLQGPVVADARLALERGEPAPALKWVRKENEAEIRAIFKQVLAARGEGDAAKTVAERFFFETLVRIHRAGEGEPFTGLKPASSVDTGILAADRALQSGSVKELAQQMAAAVSAGIQKRFTAAAERKKNADNSIEAGREYVEAYVDYIHFVEGIHQLATKGASHQHPE
jgi:hypothetical protein